MSGDTQTLSRSPRKWLSAPQKLKIVEESFEIRQTIAKVCNDPAVSAQLMRLI